MKFFLPMLVLLILTSCDGVRERREVEKNSIYLQKEITSPKPLVYLKNLPHVEEVSAYISNNSPTLVAKEASREIEELENSCTGCLSSDRLVTPIRLELIPTGTNFKVIDEYLSYRITPLGPSKIHMLLLRDENNNISEMSELSFELNFVVKQNSKNRLSKSEIETLSMLDMIKEIDSIVIKFCPKINIGNNLSVNDFIHDFRLENEIKVHEDSPSCKKGTVMTFFSPESLLTARYYFNEWSLYGKWYVIPYSETIH